MQERGIIVVYMGRAQPQIFCHLQNMRAIAVADRSLIAPITKHKTPSSRWGKCGALSLCCLLEGLFTPLDKLLVFDRIRTA